MVEQQRDSQEDRRTETSGVVAADEMLPLEDLVSPLSSCRSSHLLLTRRCFKKQRWACMFAERRPTNPLFHDRASVCSAPQAEVHTSVKTLLGTTSLFLDAPCLFVMFLLWFLPLLRIKVSFSRKLLVRVSFYLGLVVRTTRVLLQSCSSCRPSREPPALTSCSVWSSSGSASGGRGYSSAADSIGPASERAVGERCCSNHSSRWPGPHTQTWKILVPERTGSSRRRR